MELTFYNPGGELTFSADGITYGYIGRASQAGLYQANYTTVGATVVEASTGYSLYTIDWNGDIIVVLPVKTNGATCLMNKIRSGNTWTIRVFKSNGTLDSYGFGNQEYTEVHVFAAPQPDATSQFMIYDANGNPSGDLARLPLLIKGTLSLSASSADRTWSPPSPVAAPGIIGVPYGYNYSSTKPGGYFINRVYYYGWILETSGAISRTNFQNEWVRDDGGIGNSVNPSATQALITTTQGLS